MEEDSDDLLWRRVLRDADDAFARVWDRHFPRVLRHLRRLSDNSSDAEDLAAMTLLEAWRKRHRVRFVDGSLLPWLLVTATNLHKNAARARARYARVLQQASQTTHAPDPADTYEQSQLDPSLRDALAALTPQDLSLLLLVALEGMAIKDAASAVGLREATARMRLSRLRTRMQADVALRALAEGVTT